MSVKPFEFFSQLPEGFIWFITLSPENKNNKRIWKYRSERGKE